VHEHLTSKECYICCTFEEDGALISRQNLLEELASEIFSYDSAYIKRNAYFIF
jgi:hypothetical protein